MGLGGFGALRSGPCNSAAASSDAAPLPVKAKDTYSLNIICIAAGWPSGYCQCASASVFRQPIGGSGRPSRPTADALTIRSGQVQEFNIFFFSRQLESRGCTSHERPLCAWLLR